MAKVFTIKMTLGMPKHQIPTNTIKKWVGALLNGGGASKLVQITLVPASFKTDSLTNYLVKKADCCVYVAEAIVLVTKDTFMDGTKVTGKEFAHKLTTVIPCISQNDEPIGMEVIDITCSRL